MKVWERKRGSDELGGYMIVPKDQEKVGWENIVFGDFLISSLKSLVSGSYTFKRLGIIALTVRFWRCNSDDRSYYEPHRQTVSTVAALGQNLTNRSDGRMFNRRTRLREDSTHNLFAKDSTRIAQKQKDSYQMSGKGSNQKLTRPLVEDISAVVCGKII